MQVEYGPNSLDEPDFLYKLQHKIKVFETQNPLPNCGYNLVASSSKYGILFVAAPNGVLSAYQLNQVIDKECEPQHTTTKLQEIPTHIGVNCTQELLAVTGGQLICVYKVIDFQNQTTSPAAVIKTETSPSTYVSSLQWNPCHPDSLAMAYYDGTLLISQVSTNQLKKVQSKARCICWSPKGKQLVTANSDGTLSQYLPELTVAKTVTSPNLFDSVEAVAIYWISTFQFAVVYKNSSVNCRPAVAIVNAGKTGQTCLNYEDVCFSMGSNRPWYYYLQGIAQWNIVLAASSNSTEIATLGSLDGTTWTQFCQPDEGRPELPLTNKKLENYPVGMCIDTCAIHQLPWGENEVLPFMPRLHVVSQSGLLTIFNIVNLTKGAAQICAPPEQLTLPANNMTNVIPSDVPQAEPQAQSPPATAAVTIQKPMALPAQPIPIQIPLVPKPSQFPQAANYATQPSQFPQSISNAGQQTQFSQLATSVAQPVQFPPSTISPIQPFAASMNSISQPTQFPLSANNASQPIQQPQIAVPKVTLPVKPVEQKEVKPTPVVQPQPLTQPQAPQQPAAPQPKPIPKTPQPPQIQENAALKAEQEKISKEKANQELKNMLIKEVNDFQSDLYKFMLKTRETQAKLQQDIDAINMNFDTNSLDTEQLRKECALEELRQTIIQFKLELVRTCAVVAEARTHAEAKDLEQWTQVDPLALKRIASVKKLAYYVQNQLEQARQTLGYRWNEMESRESYSKSGARMIRPRLDEVYQLLVKQQEIVARQQAVLRTLRNTVNDCDVTPVFKSTSILRSTPLRTKDPLSKLTKNILNMSIEPQSKKPLLTAQKIDALRDLLSNHRPIKIKPVNVELRQYLANMKLNYEKSMQEKKPKQESVEQVPMKTELPKVEPKFVPAPVPIANVKVEPKQEAPAIKPVTPLAASGVSFTPVPITKPVAPAFGNVARTLFTDGPKPEPQKPAVQSPMPVQSQSHYKMMQSMGFSPLNTAPASAATKSVLKDLLQNKSQANLEAKTDANTFMGQKICSPTSFTATPAATTAPVILKDKTVSSSSNVFPKFQPQSFISESKPLVTITPKSNETGEAESSANAKSLETKTTDNNTNKLFDFKNLGLTANVPDVLKSHNQDATKAEIKGTVKIPEKPMEKSKENIPDTESPKVSQATDKTETASKPLVPLSGNVSAPIFSATTLPVVTSASSVANESQKPEVKEVKSEVLKPIEKPEVTVASSASSIFASANVTVPTVPKPQPAIIIPIPQTPQVAKSDTTESTKPESVEVATSKANETEPTTTASSLFSAAATSQAKTTAPSGSIFSTTTPTTTPSAFSSQTSIFGTSTVASAMFGTSSAQSVFSEASKTSLFSTPSSTAASVFGTAKTQSGSIFAPVTTQTPTFGTTTTAPSAFSSTGSVFGTAASTPSSVFGGTTSSIFGTAATTTQSSLFGTPTPVSSAFTTSASIFGSVTTTTQSMFGSTPSVSQSSVFGATTGQTSVFGSPAQTTQASVFGTSAQSGVFGSPASTTQSSVFGTPTQTTQSSIFGTPTQTTQASVFGSPAATTAQSGSLFGGAEANLFASASISTTSAPSQSGGSIFGGSSSGSVFGSSNTNVFGGNTTFGQSNPTAAAIFGGANASNQPKPTSNFWSGGNTSGVSTFGTSAFGQQNTTQASSIFGSGTGGSFSSPQPAGTTAFGSPQQGSTFGAAPAFGGSPVFGSKPVFGQSAGSPTGGGFGSFGGFNKSPSSGFGGPPSFGGAPAFGSSAFGNTSPGKVFGGGAAPAFGSPTQSNARFESLASQNTLTFGNLAQQSGQPAPQAPSFNTSPSFTGWRG